MNFTKVIKGGLAVAMCASLVACSSGAKEESTATTATTDGGTTTTTAAIKIGASGPLTGDAAVYGKAVQNGATIAVEEINALGGVQLELKVEDDQADGEMAVNAYNTLIDWGMQASLGTVTSGAGQAVSQSYKDDNIFAITPSGSSTGVIFADMNDSSTAYGNVFQMCFTDPNQGTASAVYFNDNFAGKKVGIIYRNDDNYSTGIYTNFAAKAGELGIEIVDTETFQEGATDFSTAISKLSAAGAEVVFLPIYYQPASLILQAAKTAGYEPTFFGCDGMDGILSQEGFDATLAEGLYMLTPFSADSTDPKTAAFVAAYQSKYGETPNQFAADAYDAVYAIAQAAEAAGVTADMSTDDITTALVGQFTSMTFDGITGTSVTWAATGEVTKAPKAIVVTGGVYTSAE